jgi:glycosyltransferase involved in cell wall biosynthesis
MKIGFTLDTLTSITGKERVVYELAKRLAKKHEVSVITFKNKTNKKIYGMFKREGIKFTFLKYPNPIKGRINYLTTYKNFISQLDLDVINTHGLILANAASLSKIPTVKTFHAHVISKEEFFLIH